MSLFLTLAAATALANVKLVSFFPNAGFPEAGKESTLEFDNVDPAIPFNQVVPSWNVDAADGASVQVKIRAHGDGYDSKWYSFGTWALGDASGRTSLNGQKDENGNVDTDTFIPKKPAKSVDVQVTLRNDKQGSPKLTLLALSFANTKDATPSDKQPSPAWGKIIEVPQRAQGNYPNGGVLCSATSVSMMLWHYANVLGKPDMNKDVPEVEANVWDKTYDGAGNWPFNAAYAGSFPDMRAYIARFRGISDLEKWIEAGLPVVCSISLDLANGKPQDNGSGHLVVLVGFTKDGDPVFNDPARKAEVRRTYTRENFERAWLHSHRTVYLIYPKDAKVPADPGGVWIAP